MIEQVIDLWVLFVLTMAFAPYILVNAQTKI